jgi:hypothetical protein
VLSSSKRPSINRFEYLHGPSTSKPLLDSLSVLDVSGLQTILGAMRKQRQAKQITKKVNAAPGLPTEKKIRVYGKTGTGERNISVKEHHREKKGQYFTEKVVNGKTVWVEDLERPYGVDSKSNVSLFIALVENAENQPDKIGSDRLGIVVRVPRAKQHNGRVTGASVAAPITQEIIVVLQDLDLLPPPTE